MKDMNIDQMKTYKSVDVTVYVDVDLSSLAIANPDNYDERISSWVCILSMDLGWTSCYIGVLPYGSSPARAFVISPITTPSTCS